jgi:hypothetical protein
MQDFLADFQTTVETSAERLLAMPEDESGVVRFDGQWSARQVLGHLIDSAANNHQRFVRAQLADHLSFEGYDQEQWIKVQHYERASWPLLIQLWKSYNLHLLHVIAAIPEETLQQPRARHSLDRIAWQTVSASEPATLEYLIRDYLGHMKDHLQQIFGAS